MKHMRRTLLVIRPKAGTVIAFIALIAALSGTAYAAGRIGTNQLKDNAVTSAKIHDGAVSTSKLAPSERSQGFATNQAGKLSLPPAADTNVVQLSLPTNRTYIVTAAADLGSNGAGGLVECQLLQNNNPIATGHGNLAAMAVFSQTITLTAASSGGTVRLVCTPDSGSQAKSRAMTAVRIGSLTTQ